MFHTRRNFSAIFKSIMVAILITYIPYILGRLYWFCPDDTLLNQIAEGSYGKDYSQFLIFENIILGYFIKLCYMMFSGVNMYAIVMLFIVAMSFGVFYWVIIRKVNSKLIFPFVVAVHIFILCHITYTLIAGISVCAGVVLLYETECRRRKLIEISDVISVVFVVLGSMIRIEGALIAIALSVVLLFGQMKCKGKIGKSVFIVAIISMIGIGITTEINSLFYSAEPWSSQMERLDYRMVDWNKIAYSEYNKEYDDLSMTENDVDCYYSWIFADFDVFSIENLRSIKKFAKLNTLYDFDILSLIKKMLTFKFNYLYVLVAAILFTFCKKEERKKFLCIFIMAELLFLALLIRQRPVLNAVLTIYVVSCVMMLLYLEINKNRHGIIGICMSMIVVGIVCGENVNITKASQKNGKEQRYLNEFMECHKDKLIVGSAGTLNSYLENQKISLSAQADKYLLQRLKLGTWDMGSARWYSQAEQYDLKPQNVLMEIAGNDNVYLAIGSDNEYKLINTFLKEHIGENVVFDEVTALENGWKMYDVNIK